MPHVPDTGPGKRVTDAGARTEGRGQPSNIRGGSRMQESCTYGSVRGAPSNGCPYRNRCAPPDSAALVMPPDLPDFRAISGRIPSHPALGAPRNRRIAPSRATAQIFGASSGTTVEQKY